MSQYGADSVHLEPLGQWAGVRRQPSEMGGCPNEALGPAPRQEIEDKQDESASGDETQANPRYWIALASASELATLGLGGRSD
ncbi:hypothetical protein ACHAQJ_010319 [Trichoderma viride]